LRRRVTERLINLCQHFRATRYISGNAAQNYLDVAQFAAAGIEVVWHNYVHPNYAQQHGEFVPYLSVLDLLLNVGLDSPAVLQAMVTAAGENVPRCDRWRGK
jgi:WbqC-like protein family